jgi:hypothetical protein
MNPLFRSAVSLSTLAAFAVGVYDAGKTRKPPANVVGQMLAATSTGTLTGTVMPNAITGQVYDTWQGRPLKITLA